MERAFKKILIAVDHSECSACAVRAGCTVAADMGAEVLLVHVVNRPSIPSASVSESQASLRALLRRKGRALLRRTRATAAAATVATNEVLREGVAAEEILAAAAEWGAQLIVLGVYGRTRLAPLLLGSTAEAVAGSACCPVLTVGDDGRCVEISPKLVR